MGSLQCVLVCFIAMFLSHVAARSCKYIHTKMSCSNRAADQSLCLHYIDSMIPVATS